ncbi:MAG: methionine synthase [Candidatus Thorarchaeota archaeon]
MTTTSPSTISNKLILGACLGNCVHVAGTLNFLQLAKVKGYSTKFLGPSTPISTILDEVEKTGTPIIGLSYRLTPAAAYRLVQKLKKEVHNRGLTNRIWIFGGTTPVTEKVREVGFFDFYFDGNSTDEDVLKFLAADCNPQKLEQGMQSKGPGTHATTLLGRMAERKPWPVIRHHFGVPSLEETIQGIAKIADAKCLDIISIGPDQNAQQFFFRPAEMNNVVEGAGGVPIRSKEDLRAMYDASQRGNYPLLRCYSGTQDLLKWAKLLKKTINNAWGAIPINWYSALDARSTRPLTAAIRENMKAIAWHSKQGIPIEVNEPHHWSLRQAHDTIAVASAFWSAFIAKSMGVKHYIAQLMMNTPLGTSPAMDSAKMWAKLTLVESLQDNSFKVHRQVRAGLFSFPVDSDAAKGQLASSTYTSMMLEPAIVHVVGFCEANHAATADDVITSCKIARQVIKECRRGVPSPQLDPQILVRKKQLVSEAGLLLRVLAELTEEKKLHPLLNPATYEQALKRGILDAPGLRGNSIARGRLRTQIIDGACYAIDESGDVLSESARLEELVPKVLDASEKREKENETLVYQIA